MFLFFADNKLNYEKGQLAPVFILILVVLIIMAMVTVNLSKVASIKTDSANSADAGALAAGSVMASVFNAVAQANSAMEAAYWEFYAAVSVEFVIAYFYLTSALALTCPRPCLAATPLGKFIAANAAILVSVTAYHIAQYFSYKSIRKMGEEGRESAINIGQKFAFSNSGIGSKLKEGSPAEPLVGSETNYRNEFSNFLDGIDSNEEYTYSWQDGQGREHSAQVRVTIDPLDDYELRVTVMPLLAELGVLAGSLALAFSVQALLATACMCQDTFYICIACCSPKTPWCCACAAAAHNCWMASCAAATAQISIIKVLMAAAWAGLLPGLVVSNNLVDTATTFIICWIEDIDHNRQVRLDTAQHHQGEDLGLWQVRYPDTESYSVVDFRGMGAIHSPELKHDASIIATDAGA